MYVNADSSTCCWQGSFKIPRGHLGLCGGGALVRTPAFSMLVSISVNGLL